VVPTGRLGAELLTVLARLALTARVDETTHPDTIADLVTGDRVSYSSNGARDLVSDDDRIVSRTPFVPRGVDVAVADPGVGDIDEDVVVTQIATLDGGRNEGGTGRGDLKDVGGVRHTPNLGGAVAHAGLRGS
jgi:hypothetical protein